MTSERKERIEFELTHRQPDLTVVMENVFDPHNISAVMRTCDAVGIQEIYVLNTKIPRHKKWGSKSSSSAAKWLTVHQFDHIDDCFRALRKKYDKIYSTHLGADSISVYDINFTQSVALIFGNEHSGVSEDIRGLCDGNFIIPQFGMIRSLNISVACAVSIYEASRQKNLVGHYGSCRLSEREYNRLHEIWSLNKAD